MVAPASPGVKPPDKAPARPWLRILAVASALLAIITLVVAIILTYQIPGAPALALTIVWAILGLVIALAIFLTWRFLRRGRITATVIASVVVLALAATNGLISWIAWESKSTFNAFHEEPQAEVEFVLLKNTHRDPATTPNQPIGVLDDDFGQFDFSATVSDVLSEPDSESHSEQFTFSTQENLSALISGLEDNSLATAIMRHAAYDALLASLPELENSLTVVATFPAPLNPGATPEAAPTESHSPADLVSEPALVYISGIDNAGDISASGRSDVNILAAVNPSTRQVLMVSTPRDYYVQLAGTSAARDAKDKLTHAGIYGTDTARRTLEDLYNVEIPYQVRVNFTTLLELIDIIGPIEVYTPTAVGRFPAGLNTLNSADALEFSRQRYGLEGGDRARGENQLLVLEGILYKLAASRDPETLLRIVNHVEGSMETNISPETIRDFAFNQALAREPWEFQRFSVDGSDATAETYSMPGYPLYVMLPDQATVAEARAMISNVIDTD